MIVLSASTPGRGEHRLMNAWIGIVSPVQLHLASSGIIQTKYQQESKAGEQFGGAS